MDTPNYEEIAAPEGKNPCEYDSIERRADLLRTIYREGHPYAIPQVVLAKRYGVSQQQICSDMKELREYISMNAGVDIGVRTKVAFERIYTSLLEKGDEMGAWKVIMDWVRWTDDRGRRGSLSHSEGTPNVIVFETVSSNRR